jgi:arylsulfatase A-like enzyme
MNGRLAVLKDDWKLIRYEVKKTDKITTELYNLKEDPSEQSNLAEKFPERVNEMMKLMTESNTSTEKYSIKANP